MPPAAWNPSGGARKRDRHQCPRQAAARGDPHASTHPLPAPRIHTHANTPTLGGSGPSAAPGTRTPHDPRTTGGQQVLSQDCLYANPKWRDSPTASLPEMRRLRWKQPRRAEGTAGSGWNTQNVPSRGALWCHTSKLMRTCPLFLSNF